MSRSILAAAAALALAAMTPLAPAVADGPEAGLDRIELSADSATMGTDELGEVSGGTLMGSPVEGEAWRGSEGYPMEFPASVSAAGGPVAGAAMTGADLGHAPPAGGEIGTAGGMAGDVAGILW